MFEYDLGPQIIYVVYIAGMASDTREFTRADAQEPDVRDSDSIIHATKT